MIQSEDIYAWFSTLVPSEQHNNWRLYWNHVASLLLKVNHGFLLWRSRDVIAALRTRDRNMSVVKIYATPNFFFLTDHVQKLESMGKVQTFTSWFSYVIMLMHAAFRKVIDYSLCISKTVSGKLHVLYMCLTDSVIEKKNCLTDGSY